MLTTIWNVQGSISNLVLKEELISGTSTQHWTVAQELDMRHVTGWLYREGRGCRSVLLHSAISKTFSLQLFPKAIHWIFSTYHGTVFNNCLYWNERLSLTISIWSLMLLLLERFSLKLRMCIINLKVCYALWRCDIIHIWNQTNPPHC